MTILITGATGILGSALAKALVAGGYRVAILKHRDSPITRLAGIEHRLTVWDTEDGLEHVFPGAGEIGVIIHCATCYGRGGESMETLHQVNVAEPIRLLEIAREAGVSSFINTDTCLPPETSAYAASKRRFLDAGRLLAGSGNLRFINFRLQHLYGPPYDEANFIGRVVRSCCSNQPDLDLTEGEQLRDFIYFDDAVAAYTCLVRNLQHDHTILDEYEVGSGSPISVREVVESIKRLSRSTTRLRFGAVSYRPFEPMRLSANIDSLCDLGWRPEFSLELGLSKTIDTEKMR